MKIKKINGAYVVDEDGKLIGKINKQGKLEPFQKDNGRIIIPANSIGWVSNEITKPKHFGEL